jgi:hypothetical protein
MTVDEMIAVLQAHKEGKKIESNSHDGYGWLLTPCPVWNFLRYDYRVKQEPREFFIVLDGQGSPVGVGASNGCAKIPSGTDMRSLNTVKVREIL